jgi:hypothetical protein
MIKLKIDTRDARKLEADLKKFQKSMPHAVRNGLNRTAFQGRKDWNAEIERTMTVRNTFTTRRTIVDKASGTNLQSMRAVLGSAAPYMGDREQGETKSKKGKHGVPIPTVGVARGSIKKLVRPSNKLGAIRLQDRTGSSRKQRNAIALRMAVKRGSKFAFLELDGGGGLFKVTGRKRLNVRMVWDLRRTSVQVPPMPTLERTLQKLDPKIDRFMVDAVVEQLRRNHLFGY